MLLSYRPKPLLSSVRSSCFRRLEKLICWGLASGFIFALISCENELGKIKSLATTEVLPGITAEGYEMLFSDSAVIRFKMQTPYLIRHDQDKEPYTEFPQGVLIEKYDAQMNIISSITAEYAKNFDRDQRWEAKNNVVAVNVNGDTLKTEYLVWDTNRQKIYSDQFVKFIRKDKTITGIGFESNQDFTDYKIKNIKGILYVEMNQ
jgi:LPS export ABC transporter protein LptC